MPAQHVALASAADSCRDSFAAQALTDRERGGVLFWWSRPGVIRTQIIRSIEAYRAALSTAVSAAARALAVEEHWPLADLPSPHRIAIALTLPKDVKCGTDHSASTALP